MNDLPQAEATASMIQARLLLMICLAIFLYLSSQCGCEKLQQKRNQQFNNVRADNTGNESNTFADRLSGIDGPEQGKPCANLDNCYKLDAAVSEEQRGNIPSCRQ